MTRALKDGNFLKPNIVGITNAIYHNICQTNPEKKYNCEFFSKCSGSELLVRIGSTVTGPILCALAVPAFLLAAVGFAIKSLVDLGSGNTDIALMNAIIAGSSAALILPTLLALALNPLVNLIDAIGSGINSFRALKEVNTDNTQVSVHV